MQVYRTSTQPGSESLVTFPAWKSEATCLGENQKESLFRSTRREFQLTWRIRLEIVAINVMWHGDSANMDAHEKRIFLMSGKKSGHGVGSVGSEFVRFQDNDKITAIVPARLNGSNPQFFEDLATLEWQIFQIRQICWKSNNLLTVHLEFPIQAMSFIWPPSPSDEARCDVGVFGSSFRILLEEVHKAFGFSSDHCCIP
jgi:hypothetical protein